MLYVEGTADRTLAWKLGVDKGEITGANGKGRVLRQLVRQPNYRGLVDEDPFSPQPNLLNRFVEIGTDESRRLGLRVYRLGQRGNTLIMLCPRLEDWLIQTTRDVGLMLDGYGLPTNAKSSTTSLMTNSPNLNVSSTTCSPPAPPASNAYKPC